MQQSSAEVSLPSTNMSTPPSNAERRETLFQQLAVAQTVLSQAINLIDNHLQADDQLCVHSQYMPGSTIGLLQLNGYASVGLNSRQENICVMLETTLLSCWTVW